MYRLSRKKCQTFPVSSETNVRICHCEAVLSAEKKISNTINNDFTHLSVKKLATFQQPLLTHRLLLIPMASLLSISLFSFQYHYSHYSESSHLMLCFATQLFCIGLYQEKKNGISAHPADRGVEFLSRMLQEEVCESYLNTGEMQVHDTGHVETHTQHQQQQHQHPPERAEQRRVQNEKGFT